MKKCQYTCSTPSRAAAPRSVATCSGATTSLAPAQSATFTATYVVTLADLNHGSINDSATATGKDPQNATVPSNAATAVVTATQTPLLTLAKTASPTTVSALGSTVTYTFAVTNSGNVTMTGVGINDARALVARLADAGLLVLDEPRRTRTRLLQPVRAHAAARLDPEQEDAARGRLATWCLALAEGLDQNLHSPAEDEVIDRFMVELHAQFPEYDFAGHKGYVTPVHTAALRAYGPCPEHRRSYVNVARADASLRARQSEENGIPPGLPRAAAATVGALVLQAHVSTSGESA